MPRDISPKKISKDISLDIERMRKLLGTIENDPRRYDRFLENPAVNLREFDIDLNKYSSKKVRPEEIESEIIAIARETVEKGLMDRLRPIFEMIANTSYRSNTNTSYEYNFDNSSHSDYKYESHTGTERGTFSETSTGSAINTDTSFSSFSAMKIYEYLQGPMIDQVIIENVLNQVEKTLNQAAMRTGGM